LKNNKNLKKYYSYYAFAIRVIIGGIFLISSISKFSDIISFRYSVTLLKLFYAPVREVITFAIPSIELILGIFLIIGLFTRFALLHSIFLFIGFAYISYQAMLLSVAEGCECFGQIVNLKYDYTHMAIIFVFIIIMISVLFDRCKFGTLDRLIEARKNRS
jgi:uncharacterized membrane protein YphA (DoxX/SURF4 family)